MDNTSTIGNPEVCDDCIDVAYDMGMNGYDEQAYVMMSMGRELPDHDCIEVLEPGLMKCACGCRGIGE